MKTIAIIGGGIGGLTTAIALRKRGFEVEVFETASVFKDVGSGINLGINATQIFQKLGLYDDVVKEGNIIHRMKATNKKLQPITISEFENAEKKFGVKNVTIHRYVLHKILLEALVGVTIHLNKQLLSLKNKENAVHLEFKDGTKATFDLVIGADGIHSAVRQSIFDNTSLRDANQVCWRGISQTNIDNKYNSELNEVWDKGKRFGFVQINPNEIYWYALIDKDKFEKGMKPSNVFNDYHKDIQNILGNTTADKIIFSEIWDLKPFNNWHKGNVCLLGDAAHATTPNMGQGACQAIESAYVLANSLAENSDTSEAFKASQSQRIKRTHYIVNTSWKLGKLAQSNNRFIIFLRNTIMKALTNSMKEKQSNKLFNVSD